MINFLAYHEFPCTIFLELRFRHFLYLYFVLFITVNEANSKHSQISGSVTNFNGKILIFHGVPSALEKTFQIQGLLKDFKDLHEPWNFLVATATPVIVTICFHDSVYSVLS